MGIRRMYREMKAEHHAEKAMKAVSAGDMAEAMYRMGKAEHHAAKAIEHSSKVEDLLPMMFVQMASRKGHEAIEQEFLGKARKIKF